MRLFAAVLPPAPAVEELGRAADRLRGPADGDSGVLRWTERSGWHFTLAFLGEVDDALLPEVTERLRRAAHRTEPFTLRVHGSGHFGDRALWAGAAGGLDELRLLAERADAAARRAGVAMEEHVRYQPHLTLARTGRSRSRRDSAAEGAGTVLKPYVEELAGFEGTPWEVTELSLVHSRPRNGGAGEAGGEPRYKAGGEPRYETVARCALGAAGGGPADGR